MPRKALYKCSTDVSKCADMIMILWFPQASVNVSSALMLAQQLSSLTSRAALFGDVMDVIFVTHLVERLTRLVDHVREVRVRVSSAQIQSRVFNVTQITG